MSPDGFWMLILCHFAGDYLLQNDYHAKHNKAAGVFGLAVCSFHVLLYSIPFAFTGLLWWQVGAIFVQHLIQDGVCSLVHACDRHPNPKPHPAPVFGMTRRWGVTSSGMIDNRPTAYYHRKRLLTE